MLKINLLDCMKRHTRCKKAIKASKTCKTSLAYPDTAQPVIARTGAMAKTAAARLHSTVT